jgi:N-carbamoyl-L-amino-acid hydrolase
MEVLAEPLWSMEPTRFDASLVELGATIAPRHGKSMRLFGGPGHDAVEIARRVPAAMVFAPSKRGLSHVAEEDTEPEQLARAITAFGELVSEVLGCAD